MLRVRCVLLRLVVAVLVRGDDDETVRTLHKAMALEGWYIWAGGRPAGAVAERWAAVDAAPLKSDGAVVYLKPVVNETNVAGMVGAVYAALGCRWADSVVAVLKSLGAVAQAGEQFRRMLYDVNRTVLKAESALFRLAELSPDVLAREPGPLSTALSLNLRLNRAADDDCTWTAYEIAAAVNTVERFTIGKCTAAVRSWPSPPDDEVESDGHIERLEHMLDRTGLVAPDYRKYNVNGRAPSIAGVAPIQLSVVHRVANNFRTLLGRPVDKHLTFDHVDDVFRYQNTVYDRIRLVIHSYTLGYLAELGANLRNSGDNYLDETYIRDNDLVSYYRQLSIRADVAQFPPDIVDHVRLMSRLVDSVLRFKTVRGINVYELRENEYLARLQSKNTKVTVSKAVLEKYTSSAAESKRFELHRFLYDVLFVKYVKYYNNIFKLSKYDFQEVKDRHRVIDVKLKRFFIHVYARCFDIQFVSGSDGPIPRNVLNTKFMIIFKILKYIINFHQIIHPTVSFNVLIEATHFLRYNQIQYSDADGYVQDKLNRTMYMFTNIIDRYQIIHFETHTLRDDAYYLFKNNNYSEYFDDLDFLQRTHIDENLELTNSQEQLKFCVLFNDIYNIQLDMRSSVKLFWKDELQNINDILDNVTENLFDLYSISKYVQVFIEWVTAVISYTLLDFIKNILIGNTIFQLYTYIEKWNSYGWPEYCLVALKTVIGKMSKTEVSSFELVELQSILENNLHQYSNTVRRDVDYQVPIQLSAEMFVVKANELNDLLTFIFHSDNMFTDKCYTIQFKNLLVYYLPGYFLYV